MKNGASLFWINWSAVWRISLMGGALASFGDAVHVWTATTGYPQSYALFLGPIPFWVPVLFSTAALATTLGQHFFVRALGQFAFFAFSKSPARPTLKLYLTCGGGFLFIYLLSGLLPLPAGGVKDLLLYSVALFFWFVMDRTPTGLVLGLVNGLVGTGFEILLVALGVFSYLPNSANILAVPSWLPALYISASTAIWVLWNAEAAVAQDTRIR